MGVDNNGILFLGLASNEVDIEKLPDFDLNYCNENGVVEALWKWSIDKNVEGFGAQYTNGYNDPGSEFDVLVGFELANSGSYGCREVGNLSELIDDKTEAFKELFGLEPKIFIMNYQW